MTQSAEKIRGREVVRPAGSDVVTAGHAWLIWVLGGVLMLTLLGVFYPRTTVSVDETRYLSVAGYLMRGQAFERSSEAWFWKPLGDGIHYERTLASLSITFSSLLVPFVLVGWRSAFLLGTIAHVLAFGGMIYVLRRRGFSPWWAMLYLLHPTSVLYSRLVLVDVPSAALVVLMLVLLHRPKPGYFAAGLVMGLAMLLKLSNFPVVGIFSAVIFVQDVMGKDRPAGKRRIGLRWLWMGLGILPGIIVLAIVNTWFFNHPMGNGYVHVGISGGWFNWTYFREHLPLYLGALMFMYPFMLISPIFLRARFRWEMRLSCLAVLLFFSAYYFIDEGNSIVEHVIRGLRFHVIVMPFYVIAYAEMLTRLMRRLRAERVLHVGLAAAVVVLAAGVAVISRQFFEHTVREADRQVQLDAALPRSGTVVVGAGATKYVSPVAHPNLRVLRLLITKELPFLLRPAHLPGVLVLARGEAIRTKAYRAATEKACVEGLAKADECFVVKPRYSPLEQFELRDLGRRIGKSRRSWHLLPHTSLPETDR